MSVFSDKGAGRLREGVGGYKQLSMVELNKDLRDGLTKCGDKLPYTNVYADALGAYREKFGCSQKEARKAIGTKTGNEILKILTESKSQSADRLKENTVICGDGDKDLENFDQMIADIEDAIKKSGADFIIAGVKKGNHIEDFLLMDYTYDTINDILQKYVSKEGIEYDSTKNEIIIKGWLNDKDAVVVFYNANNIFEELEDPSGEDGFKEINGYVVSDYNYFNEAFDKYPELKSKITPIRGAGYSAKSQSADRLEEETFQKGSIRGKALKRMKERRDRKGDPMYANGWNTRYNKPVTPKKGFEYSISVKNLYDNLGEDGLADEGFSVLIDDTAMFAQEEPQEVMKLVDDKSGDLVCIDGEVCMAVSTDDDMVTFYNGECEKSFSLRNEIIEKSACCYGGRE